MWPDGRGDDTAGLKHAMHVLAAAAQGIEPQQLPTVLCETAVELLPVAGASVSLTDGGAVRALWHATDPTAARLAEAQYTLGDGPCQKAVDLVAPVLASDLTQGPEARRWPVFAQQAVELGVRSVSSFPLGTNGLVMGTLDLYRDVVGALTGRNLHVALMARDALTFALLGLSSGRRGSDAGSDVEVRSWVEAAEADHAEVHQAVGMIMVQLGVDPQQALDRLRARAFVQGCTITAMAREVLARTVRFLPETTEVERADWQHGTEEEGR
ncbi:GAF and ANTAR domain-containing protein [Streptomyces sp. BA2]|uniref:GAF and ANTAR domain-containing protein n=1 Tax=Streptomyces sp. BA2 TaxID=436595 RepID=UPI00132A8899|nr:GAF and ANTAR domain-containing protein [Streptomyces sp. BA2]MWA08497.1 ANTAR domain-containing protein [Streptomyces sp. BA2]